MTVPWLGGIIVKRVVKKMERRCTTRRGGKGAAAGSVRVGAGVAKSWKVKALAPKHGCRGVWI